MFVADELDVDDSVLEGVRDAELQPVIDGLEDTVDVEDPVAVAVADELPDADAELVAEAVFVADELEVDDAVLDEVEVTEVDIVNG